MASSYPWVSSYVPPRQFGQYLGSHLYLLRNDRNAANFCESWNRLAGRADSFNLYHISSNLLPNYRIYNRCSWYRRFKCEGGHLLSGLLTDSGLILGHSCIAHSCVWCAAGLPQLAPKSTEQAVVFPHWTVPIPVSHLWRLPLMRCRDLYAEPIKSSDFLVWCFSFMLARCRPAMSIWVYE